MQLPTFAHLEFAAHFAFFLVALITLRVACDTLGFFF